MSSFFPRRTDCDKSCCHVLGLVANVVSKILTVCDRKSELSRVSKKPSVGVGASISAPCFAPTGRRTSRTWLKSASSPTPSTNPSCSSCTQTPWTSQLKTPSVSGPFHCAAVSSSSALQEVFCSPQACWIWPPRTVRTASGACASRSSRGESPWRTPSRFCLPPFDTTQRSETRPGRRLLH